MQLATTLSNHSLAVDQTDASVVRRAPSRPFLRHVHYFRAFAIVSIVFAHLWELPLGHEDRPLLYAVRWLLFHASTMYFLFISGFLFIHLSGKFDTKRYYRSKALYVLLPYTLLSTVIFLIKHGRTLEHENTVDVLRDLGVTLLQGTAVGPYWYIPFVTITFLISPLLLALPPRALRWLCIAASPLPLLGTRTPGVTVSLFVYLFPVYLIGCLAAMNYDAFTKFVRSKRWPLLAAAGGSSVLLAALGPVPRAIGWVNVTDALFYIQKVAICFLVLEAFQRWEYRDARLWGSIATYSFAIYFTHPILASAELRLEILSWIPDIEWLVVAGSVALVPALLGLNLLVCATAKRMLGRRSRYLIGV